MYCIPLSEAEAPERVGGKAMRLARLLGAGFPVPEGFVVTDEARAAGLTAELRDELARFTSGRTVVVRSSGIGEDGNEASFAGVLDSFLGIRTLDELERALEACWSSARSPRSVSYQEARGVRLAGMGVIVQEQVDAALSGVLFTEAGGVLVGEYTRGLGDVLVSGRVEPGRFVLSRESLELLEHEKPPEATLDEGRIRSLARAALEIEKLFGGPQDVEWALDGRGDLFVVQSRPITRDTPKQGRRSVLWSNANVSENFPGPVTPFLFSIARLGYEHYFRNLALAFGVSKERIEAAGSAFENVIGLQAARIHYNLTNIHRVLCTVPYGAWLTRSFDDFVGAKGPGATLADRPLRSALELLVIAAKTARAYLGLSRKIREFETIVDDYARRTTPARRNAASDEELRKALLAFLDVRCRRWLPASLADAAAMVTTGTLKRLVGASAGDLLKGLPGLVSARPALELWDLSRRVRDDEELLKVLRERSSADAWKTLGDEPRFALIKKAVDAYVERWGFRCSGELMMTTPSLQERPELVLDFLKPYVELEERAPHEILAAEAQRRENATVKIRDGLSRERLHPSIPFVTKAHVFATLLRWTHRSIALRERARLKQALLYSRCRLVALEIGERLVAAGELDEREDVFFLTWEEVVRFPSRTPRPRDLVAERKREHVASSRFQPPEHFTLAEGESFDEVSVANANVGVGVGADRGAKLEGIAAGSGRARGRAAVLRDASEGGRLTGNEILVAPQTDPGWGPLFPLISGLVLERGTLLSHGAILAREFGIPSVVGVRDATRLIEDGSSVEVDGDGGYVRIVE